MEAKLADALPPPGPWQFEPKWDGFRCLAFWDGARAALQSKAGQPLARYFPELVAAFAALGAPRAVLDGEIVIPVEGGLSFDDLLLRIHPSESRIRKLAAERPAMLLVFDLLVDAEGRALLDRPLDARREALEAFAARYLSGAGDVRLSPATTDRAVAQDWFARGERWGLDGVMAKRRDAEYRPGDRSGMLKIKRMRTADCVVGGFRYGEGSDVVGSLLLGLYDDAGLLHHVGFTSTLPAAERRRLTPRLESLVEPPGFTGRAPGGPSRWSRERSTEWKPLTPALVCEVRYDHFAGGRFRHGTTFLRWRPDKAPHQCRLADLEPRRGGSPGALSLVGGGARRSA
jgi:ATP-dependent DNA ligase